MRLFALILCISSIAQPTSSFAKPFHVIVDAGHGGKDNGARKYNIKEADITLSVAKKLQALLKKDPAFNVSMTRTSNRSVSLKQRALFANRRNGDLFISIHANSSLDSRAHGGEIYFQNQLPPNEEALFLASKENADKNDGSPSSAWPLYPIKLAPGTPTDVKHILKDLQRNERIRQSGLMAESIINAWTGKFSYRKRKIRQAPFYVVSNVTMPSTLVELGFVSNRQEAKRLTSNSYQNKLARELYKGLQKIKEVLDKQRPKP